MLLFGHEYGFDLTVGAVAKISALCPDGDLAQISDMLLNGGTGAIIKAQKNMMIAMSEGYEQRRALEDCGYTPMPISADIIEALRPEEFKALVDEAMSAFHADSTTTVEVAGKKPDAAPSSA